MAMQQGIENEVLYLCTLIVNERNEKKKSFIMKLQTKIS
jgi:hypothetical protein